MGGQHIQPCFLYAKEVVRGTSLKFCTLNKAGVCLSAKFQAGSSLTSVYSQSEQSKQTIPTSWEQLPGQLGIHLMTREHLTDYAVERKDNENGIARSLSVSKGVYNMSVPTLSQGETKKQRVHWRTIVFVVITALVALLFVTDLRSALAPWGLLNGQDYGVSHPEVHLWHAAIQAVVTGILISGPLFALLWRPRERPLLVQYLALAALISALVNVPFIGPFSLVIVLPILLVVALYPAPRKLLTFSREEPFSRLLLVLSLLAIVLLAPLMWRELLWQIQGVGGEQATTQQWISDVEHTLLLLLAGVLASTKRPGWQPLSLLTGVVFLYLGSAALIIPNQAGSWGVLGGVLGVLGGLAYLGATLYEMRRTRKRMQIPASETAETLRA